MKLPLKPACVVILALVCSLANPSLLFADRDQVLEKIAAEKEKQRRILKESIKTVNNKKTFSPVGFDNVYKLLGDSNPDYQRYLRELTARYQAQSEAEGAYREIVAAEILANTRGLSTKRAVYTGVFIDGKLKGESFSHHVNDVQTYLDSHYSQAKADYESRQEVASKILAQSLREAWSNEERAKAYSFAEGLVRPTRLEYEMAAAARNRSRKDGKGDVLRMNNLLGSATNTKTDVRLSEWDNYKKKNLQYLVNKGLSGESELAREKESFLYFEQEKLKEYGDRFGIKAENWRRSQRLDADIDEYRRLAASGKILNKDGEPVSGQLRLELARDAERSMADLMRDRAVKSNIIQRFSGRVDGRLTEAEKIKSDIAETPEYRALDFLNPGYTASKPEYMLALANAVREEEAKIDKWRRDFIPSSKFNTGAADAHRIAGTAGEMSLSSVDARIARYHREADEVATAFKAAADTPNPEKLRGTNHYRLLKQYGYIVPNAAGGEKYDIPTGKRLSNLQADLNLPGAHWLNVVSGKNMATAVASVAVPELAAGRVGALLAGLGATERTVLAGTKAADVLIGMGTDASFEYMETGKVDAQRLVIESTLLAGVMKGTGKATDELSKTMASSFKNPTMRKNAEVFLKNSLGLASDTTVQTYYNSMYDGTEMTYDSFLSGLVNGAVSRSAAATTKRARLPDWISNRLKGKILSRQEILTRRYADAEKRFKEVGGDDYLTGLKISKAFPVTTSERLNANYGSDRLGTERMTNRLTKALEAGDITWSDMTMLYANRPELRPVMAMINRRRDERFKSFVKNAQESALRDVKGIFEARRDRISEDTTPGSNERMLAEAENRRWYTGELKKINTEPFAPGSSNLTSDIDRSVESDYVRKYLKEIYRNRANDKKTPATSAQSWDVNEYIDVFPMIKKILPMSGRLNKTKADKAFGGLSDAEVANADLTHEQAVEANSHAAAMLHMTKRQRNKYKENILKNADAAETVLLKKQLVLSDKSLDAADRQLRKEMNDLVAKDPSLKKNPADLATLARDNLYGRRTEAIAAKEFRLNELQKKIDNTIPEKAKELESQRDRLAAEIERDWGYALREGIETYASFTGLDVVVNRGQAKKMSMRDMINDPTFNREKLKKEGFDYSDRQLDGFLRDQLMMMTHHMNGFHEGGESSVDATSAVGKYAERAILALKLKGADLTKEPYKSLNKASEALVKARKNPAELKRALEKLGGGKGRADAGLRKLSEMVMKAVPGAEGLFDPALVQDSQTSENLPIGQDLRRTRAMLANQRRFKEEQARLSFLSGPATAALKAAEDIEWIDYELAELQDKQQQQKNLGTKYLRKDWSKAEQLESELEGINQRLRFRFELGIPYSAEHSGELSDRRREIEKELAGLEENFKAAGGADAVEPHPDDVRLANLIKTKKEDKERLTDSLKEYMDKADAEEKAIAQDDPFFEGIISINSYTDTPADGNEIQLGSDCSDIDTGAATATIDFPRQTDGFVDNQALGYSKQVNTSFEIWVYIKNLSSNKYYLSPALKMPGGLWHAGGLTFEGKAGSKCKVGVILANPCASDVLKKNSKGLSALPKGTKTMHEIEVKFEGEETAEVPEDSKCSDIDTGAATATIRFPQVNGFVDDYASGYFDQVNPSFDIWTYIRDISSDKYYLTPAPKAFGNDISGLWRVQGFNYYKAKKGSKCKFGVILANSCASGELMKNSSGLTALPNGTKVMGEREVSWEGAQIETPDESISQPPEETPTEETPVSLEGWLGRWNTKRGPVTIRQDGSRLIIDLVPGGLLARYGGKMEVLTATATKIHGTWSIEFRKGTFTWNLNGRNFDGLFSDKVGDPETRPWGGDKR